MLLQVTGTCGTQGFRIHASHFLITRSLSSNRKMSWLEDVECNSSPPCWLKDHPETSLQLTQSIFKHSLGGPYEISLWIHGIPKNDKGDLEELRLRVQAAGHILGNKVEGLKISAAVHFTQVLEQRRPPICIAAVKAAMIAEGEFPLCTDVHNTDTDVFEMSAHVSKQPTHEAAKVIEALKNSSLKHRGRWHTDRWFSNYFINFHPWVGSMPDYPTHGMMSIEKRVEETKALIKHADQKYALDVQDLQLLAEWEHNHKITDAQETDAQEEDLESLAERAGALIFGDKSYTDLSPKDQKTVDTYQQRVFKESGVIMPNTREALERIKEKTNVSRHKDLD